MGVSYLPLEPNAVAVAAGLITLHTPTSSGDNSVWTADKGMDGVADVNG